MSKDKEETMNGDSAGVSEQTPEKRIGCAHYKRRAKFVVSRCSYKLRALYVS